MATTSRTVHYPTQSKVFREGLRTVLSDRLLSSHCVPLGRPSALRPCLLGACHTHAIRRGDPGSITVPLGRSQPPDQDRRSRNSGRIARYRPSKLVRRVRFPSPALIFAGQGHDYQFASDLGHARARPALAHRGLPPDDNEPSPSPDWRRQREAQWLREVARQGVSVRPDQGPAIASQGSGLLAGDVERSAQAILHSAHHQGR
jgi:hypothetical protein